jgi:type IX secretion system PorP/SprF family membrane protein
VLVKSSIGQDAVNFTQFFFNPYSLNPSYAGIDGRPSIAFAYRKQWASIEGAPTIVNLSLQAPATKRVSFGLNVLQDTRGMLSNTGLLVSMSYNIPVADQTFIRFGISGGGSWNKLDMDKLDGFSDNAIGNILSNNSYLLGNAGISVHAKSFHGGISLPLLFEPAYVSTDVFSITEVKPFQAFILHVSNRFYFNNNKNVFEPYLLYRVNTGLPSQVEFAGVLHLNHVVYVGGSYKQDFGISGLGGLKVKNSLAIGMSYSIKNTGINELNSPTYEINLGYLFGAHKKEAPVYSFVDTHKEKKSHRKSASELIAEKRKQDELNRKKKEGEALALKHQKEQEQKKQQAALAKKQKEEAQLKPAVAPHDESQTIQPGQTIQIDSIKKIHKPRFNHVDASLEVLSVETTVHTPQDEQERIARLSLHAENPTEHHDEPSVPNAERHEFVTRGTHAKELNVADYVVSGVFKEEANARHFSDGLRKLGFKSGYGHLTEKAVWYVYVFKTDDINVARTERDRLRKTKILRDSWLLTVQH